MKRGVHGMRLIVVGIAVAAMLNAVNSYLLITRRPGGGRQRGGLGRRHR